MSQAFKGSCNENFAGVILHHNKSLKLKSLKLGVFFGGGSKKHLSATFDGALPLNGRR